MSSEGNLLILEIREVTGINLLYYQWQIIVVIICTHRPWVYNTFVKDTDIVTGSYHAVSLVLNVWELSLIGLNMLQGALSNPNDVCKHFIPTNAAGLIEYRAHPFWSQKYCPFHEHDGTPRCCSCERMEPRDTRYCLDDGRSLSRCLDSAIMDTSYRTLSQDVEEGICQVLAHMWLETQIASISSSNGASTSSSVSSSKQGLDLLREKIPGDFFKHQIESDTSPIYGNGFRAGNQAKV
ncbi:hypothetical protein HAX54_021003 [Datura stramonium]|uniref:Protein DA1-like domain-containing protein n=1 Tax=Datura stramonium TaxID=4076 RepID=A0ABS8S348_DATST|nr:hypothetical protein [Datura stramonium]